ncbi:GGDEF domain-containing protein [Shewanella sairae]|uniref:diguanylate cyclase n=1 Tax=Shewanella sairae TaxID=190310 RepID=A0ABQ4P270_9GAMM|nr:GGDEF domain-containing protein [Shewanella sairae]
MIEQLPYWLLSAAVIIALQFNRSRLGYLALLMLGYYAYTKNIGFTAAEQNTYWEQILLGGSFTITWFAFVKDRGLLSPHSIVRLLGISLCFIAGFLWVWANTQYQQQLDSYLPESSGMTYRTLLPLYFCVSLVWILALWRANLVNTSIFITLCLWAVHFISPELMTLPLSMTVLAVVYILTVLTDSYFLAYRDELTGLASRRALFNLVLSLGRKYSVAMLDIDHFKKFNDTYGHDVGDQVLKLVASKIGAVKGGGKAFRYGGEEFTIIFSRKDASSVLCYLEAVREAVEDYDIVLRNEKRKSQSKATRGKDQGRNLHQTVSVTISIGVAEHENGETFEQTMKRSDLALYKAKKKGRNQVCM